MQGKRKKNTSSATTSQPSADSASASPPSSSPEESTTLCPPVEISSKVSKEGSPAEKRPMVSEEGSPSAKRSKVSEEGSPAEKRPVGNEEELPSAKRLKVSEEGSSLTNGSMKTTSKTKKQHLPNGASKYSRQTNAPSSKVPTTSASQVGAGSAASSIVKKAAQELDTSFKAPGTDPEARRAYKSLFHSANKPRPKALTSNWVTFFPYH